VASNWSYLPKKNDRPHFVNARTCVALECPDLVTILSGRSITIAPLEGF
jgi:hypothetical protein